LADAQVGQVGGGGPGRPPGSVAGRRAHRCGLREDPLVGGQDITGTPALVAEVESTSTTLLDRTEKRAVYAEAGIPAYWLVDPVAPTVTVLELVDGAYVEQAQLDERGRCTVTSPTTFQLDAAALFG
jgi:Uma2 family endonuclease